MSLGDTLLSRLVPSVLADARCVLTYINLFVDPFQKERSRSHEDPREPFYPPVVNHFINLRRIMPRVKRRPRLMFLPHPLYLEAHSFLFIFADFLLNFAQTSSSHRKEIRYYLESIKIRERNELFLDTFHKRYEEAIYFFDLYMSLSELIKFIK